MIRASKIVSILPLAIICLVFFADAESHRGDSHAFVVPPGLRLPPSSVGSTTGSSPSFHHCHPMRDTSHIQSRLRYCMLLG